MERRLRGLQDRRTFLKALRDAMGMVYEKCDAIWTKALREKLQSYRA